jgi:hypothetical protein
MTTLPTARGSVEIDAFLEQLKSPASRSSVGSSGRLIIGIDATASRSPTWDAACAIQGEMFEATAGIGGIEIQLAYYRGYNECRASRWVTTARELHTLMRSVACSGGRSQIARVLDHTIRETQTRKVAALVFIGDAIEEPVDRLCHQAGELGALGTPIFALQEGRAGDVTEAFKQVARLSGGAHLAFDLAAIGVLKTLLAAIAVYTAGGLAALEDYGRKQGGTVLQLTHQLRRDQ